MTEVRWDLKVVLIPKDVKIFLRHFSDMFHLSRVSILNWAICSFEVQLFNIFWLMYAFLIFPHLKLFYSFPHTFVFSWIYLRDLFISYLRISIMFIGLILRVLFFCASDMFKYSGLSVVGELGSSGEILSWLLLIVSLCWSLGRVWDDYGYRCLFLGLSWFGGCFVP